MRYVKIVFWILVIGVVIIALILGMKSPSQIRAAGTNINSGATSSVAWDDVSGWWDFYSPLNVIVAGTVLSGYASSSVGDISLDCATTRNGDICGTSNYGVCNGQYATHNSDGTCTGGDASGQLSGFGWNDTIGWISFCGGYATSTCPASISPYEVTIGQNTGDFSGYAWNDTDGWISFNCATGGTCGTNNYKLNTSWRATSTFGYLTSSIFDTQDVNGATLSSLIWKGSLPAGTCVNFQIAAATSTGGPWNYLGPSGDNSTYYSALCTQGINGGISSDGCAQENAPICVNSSQFNNYRYYRYKAQLRSNSVQTLTPRVDDVILNFSQ